MIAKEIIFQLVKEYDIVVEQFRPGVMDRLGIGYEKLKEINPEAHLLLHYRLWANGST